MTLSPLQQRERRSILLGGLRLVWRHPGAVVWTYFFSLLFALIFSSGLHARLASVLDHSMAAQGLNEAFDIGTMGAVVHQLGYRVPNAGATGYAGVPLYFLLYFVLVPGALFAYRINAPQRLSLLVSSGLCFFWRFVRIILLAAIVSALILGPLFALQNAWMNHVDEQVVGVTAVYRNLAGWVLIALVAAVLRVYFDLVEGYTVQLDDRYRDDGKSDRRIRKVLLPAARTLGANFGRVYGVFWLTSLLGFAAVLLTGATAVKMLAQPRVWPAFLLMQAGFFVCIFARYWMRAAGMILVGDFPLAGAMPREVETEVMQPGCGSIVYGGADEPLLERAAATPLEDPTPEPKPRFSSEDGSHF